MTKTEYFHSGCDNKHAKFTMKSGEIIYGVVTTFFIEEPSELYLIKSNNLIEYKKLEETGNKEGLRKLAAKFNIEDVENVTLFNPFEELLLKKQTEVEEKKVDWDARREKWLESISNLYSSIGDFLKGPIENGFLKIDTSNKVQISEEHIGTYTAPMLKIYIGTDIISLEPKGTLIIGSYGRIDMKGPKGEIMIIEPEWNDWKFAQRTPKLETWKITKEIFEEVISKLVS